MTQSIDVATRPWACVLRSMAAAFSVIWLATTATGCQDRWPGDGGQVAIAVAALALPGIVDAEYTLTVSQAGGAGDVIWQRTVHATRYGDGASLSYVGPCDADAAAQPNRVSLEIVALYDEHGAVSDWLDPTATAPLTRDFDCVANADTAVDFDVTVARRARQGFFDVAIALDDVFCSAKADCVDQGGDALRLVFGPDGTRWPSYVVAVACTPGEDGVPVAVDMDDPVVSCASGSATVDLSAGPGNLFGPASPAPAPLAQAMVFLTQGALSGDGGALSWLQVSVAVALAADVSGPCTLTTSFTAGAATGSVPTPIDHVVRPVVEITVPLLDADELRACSRHPLDAGDGVVATRYTRGDEVVTFDNRVIASGPTILVNADCGGACPVYVQGVSLPATATVSEVGALQLTATVIPADADDPSVTWASADDAVATVDATGLVSGVAPGDVDITATTVDGGFTATTTVTVAALTKRVGISAANYNADGPTCSLHCLNRSDCFAGLGRDGIYQNNFTYDGHSASSCAVVALDGVYDIARVSIRHQSVQTICNDSCTTECGTDGVGRVWLRRFAAPDTGWRYVGTFQRTTTAITTTWNGDFGEADAALVCRSAAGNHRDNIQVKELWLFSE